MRINTKFFPAVVLFLVFAGAVYAQAGITVNAFDSSGAWEKKTFQERKVVATTRQQSVSFIEVTIPRPGRYQLLAYVHHNWQKSFPCIYAEAVDSKGNKHKGSHKLENLLYFDRGSTGRWFFISLADNPYWQLPSGKIKISFWAQGKKDAWSDANVPMEGQVAIEKFFILPIEEEKDSYLLFLPK